MALDSGTGLGVVPHHRCGHFALPRRGQQRSTRTHTRRSKYVVVWCGHFTNAHALVLITAISTGIQVRLKIQLEPELGLFDMASGQTSRRRGGNRNRWVRRIPHLFFICFVAIACAFLGVGQIGVARSFVARCSRFKFFVSNKSTRTSGHGGHVAS